MNHRRMPRWKRRLKVFLAGKLSFTSDISASGFALELAHALAPGSMVHGTLALDGKELPFTGQVAWWAPGDTRVQERARAGLMLTGIDSAYFMALRGAPAH